MTFAGKRTSVSFMNRIFIWIKTHKLTFILLLVVLYLLYNKFLTPLSYYKTADTFSGMPRFVGSTIPQTGGGAIGGSSMLDMMPPLNEAPPAPDVTNRLVMRESYLSLLVKSVVDGQKQVIQTAENLGGYMVQSNLNNPQDAPTASVTVRVPAARLQDALQSLRTLAVKVVSENLSGQDVTDEFVDNEARLATLEKTKAKFEEILDKATNVQDILTVQQQIISLQSQIDAVKGQQNYLEKNAQMARLTAYLSTDELALPYAPSESWRPEVIFKQAVRSLVLEVRKLGTAIIWLAVYSVVWLPILLLVLFLKRRKTTQ